MFDIGFFELIIIGILALLVLGPERLPKAARTAGMWIGRIKQGMSSIQQEVNQQLHIEEMQRQLEENRRKLEETLRKQEQSIADSTGPQQAHDTGQNLASDNNTHKNNDDSADVKSVQPSPEDEGPYGTSVAQARAPAPNTSASAPLDKTSSDYKG